MLLFIVSVWIVFSFLRIFNLLFTRALVQYVERGKLDRLVGDVQYVTIRPLNWC